MTPQLCPGGLCTVARDLRPTSRRTPTQVSSGKQRTLEPQCSRGIPPHLHPSLSPRCFVTVMFGMDGRLSITPADDITMASGRVFVQNTGQAEAKWAHKRAAQTESNNEHGQLTKPKKGLFRLNGQRCKRDPAGFGLLSVGNTLLQLLTWTVLKECEQECKVFQVSKQHRRAE